MSPSRQSAEREQLEQRIEKLKQFLDMHIGGDEKFGKTYQNYFRLHYDREGHFLGADERTDVVERELRLCGYFCIITSEERQPEVDALKKEVVEAEQEAVEAKQRADLEKARADKIEAERISEREKIINNLTSIGLTPEQIANAINV